MDAHPHFPALHLHSQQVAAHHTLLLPFRPLHLRPPETSTTMSGFHRRRTAAAAALLVLFVMAAATCLVAAARPIDNDDDGSSRSMQQRAPATRLFDYLPRPRVIPRSGPSEGHNSIGQDEQEEAGEKADGRRP
ncbi:hypothetical protein SORBI_3006G275401 [Sorghum bicolor]|uniref:Uncharacterized protein n=2 Tax=Sorghum bicolor TaxID=4558 RepID=A0A1Z5RGA3_SORBI|nr:hypothetical protein SORBI_3006G275401 [Sorghum bicolor]